MIKQSNPDTVIIPTGDDRNINMGGYQTYATYNVWMSRDKCNCTRNNGRLVIHIDLDIAEYWHDGNDPYGYHRKRRNEILRELTPQRILASGMAPECVFNAHFPQPPYRNMVSPAAWHSPNR